MCHLFLFYSCLFLYIRKSFITLCYFIIHLFWYFLFFFLLSKSIDRPFIVVRSLAPHALFFSSSFSICVFCLYFSVPFSIPVVFFIFIFLFLPFSLLSSLSLFLSFLSIFNFLFLHHSFCVKKTENFVKEIRSMKMPRIMSSLKMCSIFVDVVINRFCK